MTRVYLCRLWQELAPQTSLKIRILFLMYIPRRKRWTLRVKRRKNCSNQIHNTSMDSETKKEKINKNRTKLKEKNRSAYMRRQQPVLWQEQTASRHSCRRSLHRRHLLRRSERQRSHIFQDQARAPEWINPWNSPAASAPVSPTNRHCRPKKIEQNCNSLIAESDAK